MRQEVLRDLVYWSRYRKLIKMGYIDTCYWIHGVDTIQCP